MVAILNRVPLFGRVLKSLGLALVFVIWFAEMTVAQSNLLTLSEGKDHRLAEQVVSIKKRGGRLELGIGWMKTNPLIFSKAHKERYLAFFDDLLSRWDSLLRQSLAANENILVLDDLPAHRGEMSAIFFRNLAHGKKFYDNQPRLRLVYCKNSDQPCMRGQVHFYSKEQVVALRALIFEVL